MPTDQREETEFQAALNRASTQDIIKRLDENVIARSWKRELAENEVARRTHEGGAREGSAPATGKALQERPGRNAAAIKGWIFTVLLIVCVLFVAGAFLIGQMSE